MADFGTGSVPSASPSVGLAYANVDTAESVWIDGTVLQSGVVYLRSEQDVVKRFVGSAITTSRVTYYTTPAGKNSVIRYINLCNDSGSSVTVQVWLDGLKYLSSAVVAAGQTLVHEAGNALAEGQVIEAQASAAGVNMFVTGVEESLV